MKITSFNPIITTAHYDDAVKLFEELGFEKKHLSTNIDNRGITSVTMENADGFRLNISEIKEYTQDTMGIRMNVDNFDEAYDILIKHGFKTPRGDKTIDSKSSKAATMVSPSGFSISIVQHIKDHD